MKSKEENLAIRRLSAKERYATDPEFRNKVNAKARLKYKENKAFRAASLERNRRNFLRKYHTNPAFKEEHKKRSLLSMVKMMSNPLKKEAVLKRRRAYLKTPAPLAKKLALNALHRARKLQATPPWADLRKIQDVYLNRPDGYHVDHIIPLSGKEICGLHVHYNLQYLPADKNLAKGNKLVTD